jgi:hypothetical protein
MKFTVQSSFFQAFMRRKIARINDFPRTELIFSSFHAGKNSKNTRFPRTKHIFPSPHTEKFPKTEEIPRPSLSFFRTLSENRPLPAPNF